MRVIEAHVTDSLPMSTYRNTYKSADTVRLSS